MNGKLPTGVARLDDLLGGGIPQASATLVYGPPFLGKEVLARRFALAGLEAGEPAVLVLTGETAYDADQDLARMDPRFPEWQERGLVRYVDAYSRAIGADEAHPLAAYVDSALDLNALSHAVNEAQRKALEKSPTHRVVVDSLSTLIAYTNAQTVFRFLMVLLGRMKRAGATSLLLLDHGMHPEPEVRAMKHLVDGLVEVKAEANRNHLRVEGIGVTDNPGWVEYRFTEQAVELTGSFAAGRIR